MNKTKLITPLAALALMLSAGGGFVAAAHADTTTSTAATTTSATQDPSQNGQDPSGQMHAKPAAIGTVTAVDGTTITLTDTQSGTTYTIDASSAKILKHSAPSTTATTGTQPAAPTTISASDIAVGDTLMVEGTVSGTTVTATTINDGQFMSGRGQGGPGGQRGGHGITGTVTAVNGTTLTITDKDGTSYTVDGSAAATTKMETISVSDVAVGDTVGIDGSVSGTTVTAKHIMDGVQPAPQGDATTTATTSS